MRWPSRVPGLESPLGERAHDVVRQRRDRIQLEGRAIRANHHGHGTFSRIYALPRFVALAGGRGLAAQRGDSKAD